MFCIRLSGILRQSRSSEEEENSRFSFLNKPYISTYECLPEPTPRREVSRGQTTSSEDLSFPGFQEFRKYKRINESRVITPYIPESHVQTKAKPVPREYPKIEIENADRFIIERMKQFPVPSLGSLLQMIRTYPGVGFVAMNRYHMDLVNDYQPYSFTICNYNDIDKSNYVTISPNIILEFYKGDADFMSLDRLLVEYDLFRALQEIPMFTSFRYWKAFMVWFKKIRRRKFMDAKVKIEAFFADKFKSDSKII